MWMERKKIEFGILSALFATLLALSGCGKGQGDVLAQEAPPPQQIIPGVDVTLFAVDHPEQYPIVTATRYEAPSQLIATGVVLPDISRSVPVITLASGRVVDIRARLGDKVQKDQVLLRVRSDDVGMGFDAYRKAIADELLARKQLDRTKDLYEHGAMAQQDLEVAQDNEADAKTTLETTTEHRQRSRQAQRHRRHPRACQRRNYRPGSNDRGERASLFLAKPIHDFGFDFRLDRLRHLRKRHGCCADR